MGLAARSGIPKLVTVFRNHTVFIDTGKDGKTQFHQFIFLIILAIIGLTYAVSRSSGAVCL